MPIPYQPLMHWEGWVEEVTADSVIVRLIDVQGDSPEAEAEIPLNKIPVEEHPLIQPGAYLDWRIFPGSRSEITFHRLPVITEEDVQRAMVRADELSQRIRWS